MRAAIAIASLGLIALSISLLAIGGCERHSNQTGGINILTTDVQSARMG
jgi:hypothetical protein